MGPGSRLVMEVVLDKILGHGFELLGAACSLPHVLWSPAFVVGFVYVGWLGVRRAVSLGRANAQCRWGWANHRRRRQKKAGWASQPERPWFS